MKRTRSPRELWASLLPTAGALLVLAVASRFAALDGTGVPSPTLLLVMVFAGTVGACHRPLAGGPATPGGPVTQGLGTAVLPPMLLLGGVFPAVWLGAGTFLIAELSLRLARRLFALQPVERRGLPRALESTGRAALAILAAGVVWSWLRSDRGLPVAWTGAAAAYLGVWIGLELADRKIRRPELPLRLRLILPPFAIDAAGWAVGGALALAGRAAGWRLGGILLAVFALLVLEAVRNWMLLERAQRRVRDLERLRRAGKRMFFAAQEMAAVVERIRVECAKVVPFLWFQFEALAPGSEFKSWWAGPQGVLQEGVPEPDRHPPALPGVHRRAAWQIIDHHLRVDGKVLARLQLWCDPRRLNAESIELLDHLLPQMSHSMQRCLLDREAREDPLTGLAMRRVLEKQLHEVHARCHEEGGAMAVVLCDLDHFKRINDTWGHPAGDAALVAFAGLLKETRRPADLCCRYGGEEFVLLLDRTTGTEALELAEGLRRRVEELVFEVEGQRVPLTVSAGVASFPGLFVRGAAELILFADEALYEAKRMGRNRCLLDLGQGRYQDVEGNVHETEEAPPVVEPPRIFA
ncbi:MAG TPA: GGDEF domain-containing protein [Thermoanaerobaculia bacterium]|nr:GGDEF domain-containing protein [Thermoanaerobaculia bacterium]